MAHQRAFVFTARPTTLHADTDATHRGPKPSAASQTSILHVLLLAVLTIAVQGGQPNRHLLQAPAATVATVLFRLRAPEGLLPFDAPKQSEVLAAVPRFPGVSVTLLSHCQCEASDGAPEFVDLAFKLAILSGSSAGLSSMAALNPDTPLSAIWQQAVRLWTQQLQAVVPNITVTTLSEEDVASEEGPPSRPLLRAVSVMAATIEATISGPEELHNTVAELLSAMRTRLIMGATLRVSPVSDIRLGLPLPTINGTTLRMTAELLIQRCEAGEPGAAPGLAPAPGPAGAPTPPCLQTPQGAAAYLQEALAALLPQQLPGTNVAVLPAWLPGTCSTCAIEQQGRWWALGPPPQPPWYLDMIDPPQGPSPLLDGTFAANALGTGVNVFLVSSAAHQEFATMAADGTYGGPSRVQSLYGLDGTDPLQDCSDGGSYVGIGTFAASLIAGRSTGVARNATIQSVRYKLACTSDDTRIWGRGGLSNALDSVITKVRGSQYMDSRHHPVTTQLRETAGRTPGVVVIDGWWTPGRLDTDSDDEIVEELTKRLDQLYSLNVVVITAAATGQLACKNLFGQHNSSLTIGSIDPLAVRSFQTSDAEQCIDLWAPGGSLGSSLRGAFADATNASYRSVVPRESGASWLVAGAIAQFLSQRPNANPEEVKAWIKDQAVRGQLWDVQGEGLMLRTSLRTLPTVAVEPASKQGLSSAAMGGIVASVAVAGVLLVAGVVVAGVALRRRVLLSQRRHSWDSSSSDNFARMQRKYSGSMGSLTAATDAKLRLLMESQWIISADAITICTHPDGTEDVLGEGSFGVVLRAVKDGVQPVAVKVFKTGLSQWGSNPSDVMLRELELLKFVSRDKNVVQFYGCCVKGDHVMLVTELMEGGDMRTALSNDPDGQLAWARGGKRLALDVVSGLSFLHANKVIHRDLKSKNVLLSDKGVAKICDVGLAKVHDNGYATQDSMIGTFAWAAPELLMGQKCTEKADIYSMGIVLWEILTQEVPIRGAISLPPPDALRAPLEVLQIVERCMQPDPKTRPTARELFSLLAACPPDPMSLNATPLSSDLPGVVEVTDEALYHAVHARGLPWGKEGVEMVDAALVSEDGGTLWPGQCMGSDGQGGLTSRGGSSVGPLTPPAVMYGPCMSLG